MKLKRKNQKTKILPKIFVILFFLFGVGQIFLANSLSVQGKEISRLNGLNSDLEKEIEALGQDSSYLSSLSAVRKLAFEKLQMVDGFESFDYLSTSVASR